MINNLRMFILKFIKSNKDFPFIAALSAGLYPILYYYASNFGHANSLEHVVFFIIAFIGIPFLSIVLFRFIFSKVSGLKVYRKYIIPVLNILCFGTLVVICTSGFNIWIIALVLLVALALGILFAKHIKKLMVFQLFLAFVAIFHMAPKLYSAIFQSSEWMNQPDQIEVVEFKKTPNVYLIQPDGYANFSELKKGHYKIDNIDFENYLTSKGFSLYNDYRSNYFSTISSNASLFSMRHHYYNHMQQKRVESYNSRSIIAGNNPVIDIFKNNNYKTSLLLESEYLIVNRPKMNYDYSNILYSEMPYLSKGFHIKRNLVEDVKTAIQLNSESNNFYFIEKIAPGHIAQSRYNNAGKIEERLLYIDRIKEANTWLKNIIETIENNDSNSLIILMADHGGFVGMDSIYEAKIKQDDDALIQSVFTAALAVKWPNGQKPNGLEFKTSVNFFRNLFSYLSDDASYLNHLQEDASYLAIKKEAPLGVYKAVDKDNNVIFERITD